MNGRFSILLAAAVAYACVVDACWAQTPAVAPPAVAPPSYQFPPIGAGAQTAPVFPPLSGAPSDTAPNYGPASNYAIPPSYSVAPGVAAPMVAPAAYNAAAAPGPLLASPPYTPPGPAPTQPGYVMAPPYGQGYVIGPPEPTPTIVNPKALSNWYTEVDYFHWNERVGGADFVNEAGTLFTLGYERRFSDERIRVQFFDGDMAYHGGIQFADGSSEASTSRTRYLGGSAEYEHLLEPAGFSGDFYLGLGTRAWIRDIRGSFGVLGDWSDEAQETWWTLYPYLGFEWKHELTERLQFYTNMRAGLTALGYDYSNVYQIAVYPKLGVVGELEAGVRGEHLSLTADAQVFTWSRSADQLFTTTDSSGNLQFYTVDQPTSTMFLLGGKLSYSY